jgi:hypothetical protein
MNYLEKRMNDMFSPYIEREELDYRSLIHSDNKIHIPADLWSQMNHELSQEEIIQLLSDVIEEENIPLPYREISKLEAEADFKDLLQMDCRSLIKNGSFYSRYEYNNDFADQYIDQSRTGNKSSDFFHQENRWLCNSINSPSPYRTWTTEKFRKTLFNGLWSLKYKHVDMNNIRTLIGLRKYIASQFRPTAAKAVYQHFGAKKILDFSSGWGDRLAGFLATEGAEEYFGIDPNVNLQAGYQKQIEMAKRITGKDKNAKVVPLPAEEVDIPEDYFDLVFTSPPYFIVERYTNEDNQSWQRYKKLDAWLEGFLFNVLEKSWKALKSGGIMAINISDVYCNHRNNNICDPMCDFMNSFEDSEYNGSWGFRMSKRPRSKAVGEGVFAEPIWIWKKK